MLPIQRATELNLVQLDALVINDNAIAAVLVLVKRGRSLRNNMISGDCVRCMTPSSAFYLLCDRVACSGSDADQRLHYRDVSSL